MRGFSIQNQIRIGPYRADFLINWGGINIVVECDGHDFHEKTKEQASKDKRRDRYMAALGYSVMRFTGSEIHKDSNKCAKQVSECFDRRVEMEVEVMGAG